MVIDMNDNEKLNLKELLKSNVVEIVFKKVNGDKRTMNCTLQSKFLPESVEREETRKTSDTSLAVWSVEDDGWRSFRWESIISFGIKE
jgi:WYL_2, Sm-like SH3 beta-barrel fold